MTASELARLLHARRTGRGKWLARCPSHGRDRHPSLSITEGKSAVLLKCWSHDCTPKSICDALGIRVGDLFYERRSWSPEAVKRIEAQREEEARREKAEKVKIRNLIAQARYWRCEVEKRAKLLMSHPEDGKMGSQFHWAIDRQRSAQQAIRPYFHPVFVEDADL